MALNTTILEQLADELFIADRDCSPVLPLTERFPDITVEDAYAIQQGLIGKRMAQGASLIGKKIGLTSKPIQTLLGVNEPDFGQLLSVMYVHEHDSVALSRLCQARAEGEIAFVLEKDLDMEFITAADVLRCTAFVMPSIEIIDSRVKDWKIKIQDTVADNASSGLFVLGGKKTTLDNLDLRSIGMALELNGEIGATGAGAAALGNPVKSVAWLANTLKKYGMTLKAGEIILSGALAATVTPKSGDVVSAYFSELGSVSVRFE